MRKTKFKHLLKPYFIIPACILVLVGLMFLIWQLIPSRTVKIAILDKTVPATAADSHSYLDDVSNDYRKHIGLNWISNFLKLKNPDTGTYYNYKTDYYGPILNENAEIESNRSLTELTEVPDLLYLSDTYGVELSGDRGITKEEMNIISMCYNSGSTLIGEQDIMTTATDSGVVEQLENTFGIHHTGWVGRYIYDLADLTDVPYWAPDMWRAKYGQEWNCSGPGILLVSSDGDILVLEEKTDFESKNLFRISINKEYRKEFGKRSVNFYNWFELIEAEKSTEVIATYNFNVNSTGAEELAVVSDTTTFAAVTRCVNENGTPAYYFAGDFNDYTNQLHISNFLFADYFYRLLSFDRDGDVTHFFWNFYEPLVQRIIKNVANNPVVHEEEEDQQISRLGENGFQVLTDGEWTDFIPLGFNINAEAPGDSRYTYSDDYSYFATLIESAGGMGANCIRTYDLLTPEFYRALAEYNKKNERKIYLVQGIMTPVSANTVEDTKKMDDLKSCVRKAVDAVYGEQSTDDDKGENDVYPYNVSQYVVGYILDPQFTADVTDAILSKTSKDYAYSGTYISSSRNAVEAVSAELADFLLRYLEEGHGYTVPVSVCAGSERLDGAAWVTGDGKEYGYNLSKLELSNEGADMYFVSYSLNSDDEVLVSEYARFAAGYSDSYGSFAFGGYIEEIKKLLDGHVIIDRAGLSTNLNMFEAESYINGLDETEQGEGIVRMLTAARNTGYMGMLIADLNDSWSALSDSSAAYTLSAESPLWHDVTDRAQTTGVIAVESGIPEDISMELNDNAEKSLMRQIQISYSESYLYLTVLLADDIDYDKNEMIIGIDTYLRNNGEYFYDADYFANSQSGMEYIIKFESKNATSLYVANSYNRNAGNFASKESYTGKYDLVSVLNYGNFLTSTTNFYQAGVTMHIRIPWAMLNFVSPAKKLVVNGEENGMVKTTLTDGMIFSLCVCNKETRDTEYIFPESKKSAGYKRWNLSSWNASEIEYVCREKESCSEIRKYFQSFQGTDKN